MAKYCVIIETKYELSKKFQILPFQIKLIIF